MIDWIEGLLVTNQRTQAIESITSGLNQLFEIGKVEIIPLAQVSENLNAQLQKAAICGDISLAKDLVQADLLLESGSIILTLLNYQETALGVLLMASPNLNKFTPQMGLNYVHQLAQIAAAALYRFRDE
jgi:uncharacterized protein YigA (DUF484 family)